mgnify:CR=1 FL=1
MTLLKLDGAVDSSSDDSFYFKEETTGDTKDQADADDTGTLTPDGTKVYVSANAIPQESTLDPDVGSLDSFLFRDSFGDDFIV